MVRKTIINFLLRLFESAEDRQERKRITELRRLLKELEDHPEITEQVLRKTPRKQ